jgi:hypothetical protein
MLGDLNRFIDSSLEKEFPPEQREHAKDLLSTIGGSDDEQWSLHQAMAKKLRSKGWLS